MQSFSDLEMLFILTNIDRRIAYTSAIYGTLAFVNKRGLEADDREKISCLRLNRTRIFNGSRWARGMDQKDIGFNTAALSMRLSGNSARRLQMQFSRISSGSGRISL